MRILPSLLSLFAVHTLVITLHPDRDEPPSSPWDYPGILPASIIIQDLILEPSDVPSTEGYYQFFERILAPGSLRALGTRAAPPRHFGFQLPQFLRCDAVRNLLSISVQASALIKYSDWDGPAAFERLGAAIAHCTRLQYFRIRLGRYRGGSSLNWSLACHRTTFEPVLANLPGTLRVFAIHLHVYWWQSWEVLCAEAAGLDFVDRMLESPPPSLGGGGDGAHFPLLQRVELDVWRFASQRIGPQDAKLLKECEDFIREPPNPTPLPRLKAAGLLRLQVAHKPLGLDDIIKRADLYLPPEMES